MECCSVVNNEWVLILFMPEKGMSYSGNHSLQTQRQDRLYEALNRKIGKSIGSPDITVIFTTKFKLNNP